MGSSEDTAELDKPFQLPGWDRPRLLSAQVQVDAAGLSDAGSVRENNEDHFLVARFGRFLDTLATNLPPGELADRNEETGYGFVVADGMGGHAAGEEASRVAISTLVHLVLGTPDWILRLEDDLLAREVRRRVAARYQQIQAVMAERARQDPHLSGFGTTLVFAVSLGRDLIVAHVGDSRAYLLRDGRLVALTRDHTVAQGMADIGLMLPQEVATHRMRHVLTKSLGAYGGPAEPEVREFVLEDGDALLLCTDGLTDMVPEAQIRDILGEGAAAEATAGRLVDEALRAGGRDNVTAVVARYQIPDDSEKP